MLIKKTYAETDGHLYNFFVIGANSFETSVKIPVEAKIFVKIKNGSRAGTKTLNQTSRPFNATSLYFKGLIAIKIIIKRSINGTI